MKLFRLAAGLSLALMPASLYDGFLQIQNLLTLFEGTGHRNPPWCTVKLGSMRAYITKFGNATLSKVPVELFPTPRNTVASGTR